MSQLRKTLIKEALAAGQVDYAAWIASRNYMSRQELRARLNGLRFSA